MRLRPIALARALLVMVAGGTALFGAGAAVADAKTDGSTESSTELQAVDATAELGALLDWFLAGVTDSPIEVHQRFWADDLIYTSSSGERFGKTEILARAAQSEAAAPVIRYHAEQPDFRVHGPVAIVAFRLVATQDETVEPEQYLNTGVFVRRGGQWQAVAWQATRVPANR